MLDDMIKHFRASGNQSLLARIYGVFSLETNVFSKVDLVVLQNTTETMNSKNDKIIFDLKGSLNKRFVNLPEEEKTFWKSSLNQKRVLKDLNFL